jgi:hypothetical protein
MVLLLKEATGSLNLRSSGSIWRPWSGQAELQEASAFIGAVVELVLAPTTRLSCLPAQHRGSLLRNAICAAHYRGPLVALSPSLPLSLSLSRGRSSSWSGGGEGRRPSRELRSLWTTPGGSSSSGRRERDGRLLLCFPLPLSLSLGLGSGARQSGREGGGRGAGRVYGPGLRAGLRADEEDSGAGSTRALSNLKLCGSTLSHDRRRRASKRPPRSLAVPISPLHLLPASVSI